MLVYAERGPGQASNVAFTAQAEVLSLPGGISPSLHSVYRTPPASHLASVDRFQPPHPDDVIGAARQGLKMSLPLQHTSACFTPLDCSCPLSRPPPAPPNSPGCPMQGLPIPYAHLTIDSPASPPAPASAAAPRSPPVPWGQQALCPSSCGWRHRWTHRWQQSQALQQTSGHEVGAPGPQPAPPPAADWCWRWADAMTTEQGHSMQA